MAAGLGRLGLSSNFVHTEFGASVHLCSVITEAELTPDPIVSDEDDPCHRCESCINICPVQAISWERTKSFIMEGREYTHRWVNKLLCAWGCGGLAGHQYRMGNRTVGTWSYNDLPLPDDPHQFSNYFVGTDQSLRHPMELAEMILNNGTEYCGNCHKICVGTKKETAALMKLHVNSGVVRIPDDPTLLVNLTSANANLEKYPVPGQEVATPFKR